ncbi:MAG: YdcF family protein [Cyanobacteria bacterium P01_F01_bin.150]
MPELITRLLLLVFLVTLVWYIVKELIPKEYLTVFGGVAVVVLLALIFQNPADPFVGTVWGVLSLPFKPLGLSILLMGIALFKGEERIKNPDGNLIMWAFAILLVFSTPLVAYWLTDQTQQTAQQLTALSNNDQPVEMIAVLGDGLNPADPAYRGGTQFNESDDGLGNTFVSRLQYTSQLFQNQRLLGRSPMVIVSPGPQLQRDNDILASNVINLLARFGVPPENIILDPKGSDLHSSAVEVKKKVDSLGYTETPYNLMLVGPALKIRRARSAFAKELGGLDNKIVPAPTDYYGFQAENGDLLARLSDVIPSVEALTLSTRVLDEYLGTLYYFVRGWLYNPLAL